MKIHPKLRLTLLNPWFVGSLLLVALLSSVAPANAAGNASLSLSPNSGSYAVGDDIKIKITEDSGSQAVNAIEADLQYDHGALQFIGIDASDSDFEVAAPTKTGGGVVEIPRGSISGLTGQKTVASVTFRVIAPASNSVIRFTTNSAIVTRSGNANIWDEATEGASFTLTGQASGAPATDTPTVQNQTGGLVAVQVTDANNQPVAGATVRLDSGQKAVTDKLGVASLQNVPSGSHTVEVEYDGRSKEQTIDVKPTAEIVSEPQAFNVRLTSKSQTVPAVIGALIVLLVIAFWVYWHRRQNRVMTPTS